MPPAVDGACDSAMERCKRAAIREFGLRGPILARSDDGALVDDGHSRLEAARKLAPGRRWPLARDACVWAVSIWLRKHHKRWCPMSGATTRGLRVGVHDSRGCASSSSRLRTAPTLANSLDSLRRAPGRPRRLDSLARPLSCISPPSFPVQLSAVGPSVAAASTVQLRRQLPGRCQPLTPADNYCSHFGFQVELVSDAFQAWRNLYL